VAQPHKELDVFCASEMNIKMRQALDLTIPPDHLSFAYIKIRANLESSSLGTVPEWPGGTLAQNVPMLFPTSA